MAPSLRIPQHLQPYVCSRQKHDLTLLTGILGASTNWLLIRYLCSALERSRGSKSRPLSERDVENVEKTDLAADEDTAVVLVSWMRDFEFWRAETRRSVASKIMNCVWEREPDIITRGLISTNSVSKGALPLSMASRSCSSYPCLSQTLHCLLQLILHGRPKSPICPPHARLEKSPHAPPQQTLASLLLTVSGPPQQLQYQKPPSPLNSSA